MSNRLYKALAQSQIPALLHPIFWIERFALAAHFVEGIIAAFLASRKQRAPVPYGIYTFFVGTVGLLELFALDEAVIEPNQG